ncbi:hypothetical protein Acsp06_46990 [Actinomycetospora sp. NBRC 106375]|uniref:lipopolysaccharide biosynthesis protein n=1 Tax=Actinomycetospora sp. NBRC 106375 TaxID=3032207 RepID=UPI0024A047BF|nr:oligosaccharide flippase family protein [Actinomycetospora sp. NBRC 106375]GLZ48514.1 hypothetical protein Acsp06_46990 [Actinomycetospora sp. NBRC 106375]
MPDSEHDPSLEGLESKLRRGASFAAVALVFTQLISLTQTIVVARILSPVEIGTFTLGTLFANFLTTLSDGGMRAALIQREREVEDAANTAFWISLVTGTLMSLSALAAAPVLALYFDDRLVGLICAATCGTLLIHSLLNVPEALMQRRFNFKRRLIVDPTTAGTFAIVAVTAVLLGFGVWGMVIGLYASQFATLIACWALAKWRPGRGTFTFRIWREMARYAAPLILSSIVEDLRDLVQQALVGRRLDIASAGQYRYGRRIGILPGQAIIQVASYVLFPAFARIASDITRFKHGFLRSLRMLWAGSVPFAAVLIALGEPLIVVLLGEEWRPAGLFVAAMAGYGPGTAMSAIGFESIKGAGQSAKLNWLTGITLVVGLGGLLALIPLGLLGVGLAASIEGIVAGLAGLMLARRLAAVSVRDLATVLVPPLVAAAVAGTLVGLVEHWFVHADERPIVLALLLLAGEGLLLLGIFVGLLYLMAPEAVREVRDALVRRAGRGGADDGDDDGDDDGAASRGGDPDGPLPDAGSGFYDAPTVVLPMFGLDGPTEQVYTPLRRIPRRPLPVTPDPVGSVSPTTPVPSATAPVRTPGDGSATSTPAERAERFVKAGLDAPTTALPPNPRPGPIGSDATREIRASDVAPDDEPPAESPPNGRSENGRPEEESGPARRIVPMVRVQPARRDSDPDRPVPPDPDE